MAAQLAETSAAMQVIGESMVPKWTTRTQQRRQSARGRHKVGRGRTKKMFAGGDGRWLHVCHDEVAYDYKSRLSAEGNRLKVLGSGEYSVDRGRRPQHILDGCSSELSTTEVV